jgi:hypothetical protein
MKWSSKPTDPIKQRSKNFNVDTLYEAGKNQKAAEVFRFQNIRNFNILTMLPFSGPGSRVDRD